MTDKAKLNYLKNKHDRSLEPCEFSSTRVCSVSISPCQMDGFLQSALPSKEKHLYTKHLYTLPRGDSLAFANDLPQLYG